MELPLQQPLYISGEADASIRITAAVAAAAMTSYAGVGVIGMQAFYSPSRVAGPTRV